MDSSIASRIEEAMEGLQEARRGMFGQGEAPVARHSSAPRREATEGPRARTIPQGGFLAQSMPEGRLPFRLPDGSKIRIRRNPARPLPILSRPEVRMALPQHLRRRCDLCGRTAYDATGSPVTPLVGFQGFLLCGGGEGTCMEALRRAGVGAPPAPAQVGEV